MALQIRRGLATDLTTITPATGEILYVTDYAANNLSPMYIGDGSTAGGHPVAPVVSVNSATGNVSLTTLQIPEDTHNLYFTTTRAQDAAGAMLQAGTTSGLSVSYNSSTHAITITNTNVINTGTVNALAFYPANGTTLSPSQNITWSESDNLLTLTNGIYSLQNNYTNSQTFSASTYADSTSVNSMVFRKARGTNVSPTTTLSGDGIQSINFQAHDGTSFVTGASIFSSITSTVSTGVVPAQIKIYTYDSAVNNLSPRLTASPTNGTNAVVTIGPTLTTDTGSGSLNVRQNGVSAGYIPALAASSYFSDTSGVTIQLKKFRGTFAIPTVILPNDTIGQFVARGYDGTALQTAGQMAIIADGSISSGKVPGAIVFSVANGNGALTQTTKIDHTSTLTHNGTIATTSTPGTFWNYDSSSSTVTLSVGGTVAFANFSGSVLVNCFNSGTVTQYLCGGGGAPIATGSSKVTATGTMASTSGISGYTFTATEAGVHSFYVIRTRTGA
jgi:hypothetical protein